jgi:hypothetical protein
MLTESEVLPREVGSLHAAKIGTHAAFAYTTTYSEGVQNLLGPLSKLKVIFGTRLSEYKK